MRIKKVKKILWPTDFSEAGDEAFSWALALAEKLRAEVLIRHVISSGYHPLVDEKLVRKAIEERRDSFTNKLLSYAEKVREEGLRCNIKLLEGKTWDEIVKESREENADLIVMGIKGESAIDAILTGSTFARVVHTASVPVIGIPPGAGKPRFKRAVVATDLSPNSFRALKLAAALGEHLHWDLTLLHVIYTRETPLSDEVLKALEEKVEDKCLREIKRNKIEGLDIKIEVRVSRDASVDREIVDFAETTDQSMIFLTSRTGRSLAEMLWGCVTEKVLRKTFLPVCILKV